MKHRLTKVSLVKLVDGVHSEKTDIGYIATDPEVVLDYFLLYSFVSGYNGELYPLYDVPFTCSIDISDAGSLDGFVNANKLKVFDIDEFMDLYEELLTLATPEQNVTEMYTTTDLISRYMDTLKTIAQTNRDIKLALDSQSIINKIAKCKTIQDKANLLTEYPDHEKLIRYMIYTM